MSEFLNLGVGDLVVTLVSIGTLTLGDAAALDILLDQFGDLEINCVTFLIKPKLQGIIFIF